MNNFKIDITSLSAYRNIIKRFLIMVGVFFCALVPTVLPEKITVYFVSALILLYYVLNIKQVIRLTREMSDLFKPKTVGYVLRNDRDLIKLLKHLRTKDKNLILKILKARQSVINSEDSPIDLHEEKDFSVQEQDVISDTILLDLQKKIDSLDKLLKENGNSKKSEIALVVFQIKNLVSSLSNVISHH